MWAFEELPKDMNCACDQLSRFLDVPCDEIAEQIKSLILDLDMFSDPNILDAFNSIKNGNNVTEN